MHGRQGPPIASWGTKYLLVNYISNLFHTMSYCISVCIYIHIFKTIHWFVQHWLIIPDAKHYLLVKCSKRLPDAATLASAVEMLKIWNKIFWKTKQLAEYLSHSIIITIDQISLVCKWTFQWLHILLRDVNFSFYRYCNNNNALFCVWISWFSYHS